MLFLSETPQTEAVRAMLKVERRDEKYSITFLVGSFLEPGDRLRYIIKSDKCTEWDFCSRVACAVHLFGLTSSFTCHSFVSLYQGSGLPRVHDLHPGGL